VLICMLISHTQIKKHILLFQFQLILFWSCHINKFIMFLSLQGLRKSSNCSLKLAYRILLGAEVQTRAHATGAPSHSMAAGDPRWVKLWKQKLPPKVWVFWWRVMHDYMPCQANLHHQHIDPIANCEVCGACEETTYHALVECSLAQGFWRKLKETKGIKLPKLHSQMWPEDLLDDTHCSETTELLSSVGCGHYGTLGMTFIMERNLSSIDWQLTGLWMHASTS
jgi:hypothetical protein